LPPPAVLAKEIAAAPPVPVKNEGPQNDAERDAVQAVVKLGITKTEALNLLARAKSQGPAGDSSELTRRMFRMRGR
jgi:Holliday junction resolvasome RuvABC DNA-binding subunit